MIVACWTVFVLVLNGFIWVGAGQLYTATGGPSRVCPCAGHAQGGWRCPRAIYLPFTCGFRAGEDGERVGVSEAGVGGCGGLGVTSGPVAVAECRVARVRLAGAGVAG